MGAERSFRRLGACPAPGRVPQHWEARDPGGWRPQAPPGAPNLPELDALPSRRLFDLGDEPRERREDFQQTDHSVELRARRAPQGCCLSLPCSPLDVGVDAGWRSRCGRPAMEPALVQLSCQQTPMQHEGRSPWLPPLAWMPPGPQKQMQIDGQWRRASQEPPAQQPPAGCRRPYPRARRVGPCWIAVEQEGALPAHSQEGTWDAKAHLDSGAGA